MSRQLLTSNGGGGGDTIQAHYSLFIELQDGGGSQSNTFSINIMIASDEKKSFSHSVVMKVYGLHISDDRGLTNIELHNPMQKKFRKRIVFVRGIDEIWAVDLVNMQYYTRTNKGYKYIPMIIYVFSKYGWAIQLKTKKGPEVAKAFTDLWKTQKPPKKLWTDKGTESLNKYMTASLTKHNVHLYWTENEEKSCVVERWNRMIKRMMWKYFTKHQTGIYINILPEMIKKYNSTYHRAIKCTPTDALKPANYQHVFDALYAGKNRRICEKTKPKFKIGDKVRITKKKTFEKGYTTNWTEEISQWSKFNLQYQSHTK